MSPDITQPVISIAWQQGAVALGCCFLIAVLIQSSAFKEMVRAFRLSPWRSLIILLVAVSWFTLQGSTKAPRRSWQAFQIAFLVAVFPLVAGRTVREDSGCRISGCPSSNVLVEAIRA